MKKIIYLLCFFISWKNAFEQNVYVDSTVYKYIQNQEAHHKKQSFKEEYLEFLKKFKIEYDEKYIFQDVI